MGRIWPKKKQPRDITWSDGNYTTADPINDQLKDYEGKSFVSRSCQPIDSLNYCKKFPSNEDAGFDFDREQGEIYQCNLCDTESCNSWGTTAMPDWRYNGVANGAQSRLYSISVLVLLANATLH